MTDKEFKRLSRPQLIDVIYQLQVKQEELTAENERLSKELADKRLLVSEAGNVAEAVLQIHNVMQAAQEAAEHYQEELRIRADAERQRILQEAEEAAAQIRAKAKKEAAEIVTKAKQSENKYDAVLEAILEEYR